MSGLSEHVIETFGITQAIVDAIGGVDTDTYRAITDVFIERQHEQVVRCRDCKYSSISFEETRTTCRFWALNDYDESNSSQGYTLYPCVKPYGFCAWGERRGDAE